MKTLIWIFLLYFLMSFPVNAAKPDASLVSTTLGQNTFQIENVKISRPDYHWRVVKTDSPCLTQFRYNKWKSNVNIDVCRHPETTIKHRWNTKMTTQDSKIFTKKVLSPYRAEGYKFFDINVETPMTIRAKGVNKDNQLILLHCEFSQNDKSKNPIIVEMKISRNDYFDFKAAFQAVADSLVVE